MLWQSLAPARPGPPDRRPDLILGEVDPVREGVPRRVVDVGQPLLRPLHGHGHDSEGFQSRAAFDSVGNAVASLNVPVSGEEHDTAPRSLQVPFEFQSVSVGVLGSGGMGKILCQKGRRVLHVRNGADVSTVAKSLVEIQSTTNVAKTCVMLRIACVWWDEGTSHRPRAS